MDASELDSTCFVQGGQRAKSIARRLAVDLPDTHSRELDSVAVALNLVLVIAWLQAQNGS